MAERREITYSPKIKALEFVAGRVFQRPEDVEFGKFVRIGKLVIVSLDHRVSHKSLIVEPGLCAGDEEKFIKITQKLADTRSAQLDAGWIEVSLAKKTVVLSKESLGLVERCTVPVNRQAREISREVLQALCSPDFTVQANLPTKFLPLRDRMR